MDKGKKIYAYDIDGSKTSGARFYRALCHKINSSCGSSLSCSKIVLVNVYCPIKTIIYFRLTGKKVIMRVDGLWNDRISENFLAQMNIFWRYFFVLFKNSKALHTPLSHFANFLYDNYKVFLKIFISNRIIYQSNYSRQLYETYLHKKNTVILNASTWESSTTLKRNAPDFKNKIKFCVIYSSAPLKGIYEAVKFVDWLNNIKNTEAELTVLGFDGKKHPSAPKDFLDLIQKKTFVNLLSHFEELNQTHKKALFNSHFYLSFTRADNCPNALIESMAFGLPVIGLASGGVSEIVGKAGFLVPFDDFSDGYFFANRYEYPNFDIPYEALFEGLKKLIDRYNYYCNEVEKRFQSELNLNQAASKYLSYLNSLEH